MKFQSSSCTSSGIKRVAEEEIIEVEDLAKKQYKPNENNDKPSASVPSGNSVSHSFKKPQTNKPISATKSSIIMGIKRTLK